MKKFFETVSDAFDPELTRGLAIALCVILLFSGGFFVGTFTSVEVPAQVSESTTASTQPAETTTAPTQTTEPTSAAPTDSSSQEETAAPSKDSGEETTAAVSDSMSTAEIVKLFNDSANKVKTNATKVVRNYEDRTVNEDKLVVPSVLQSMASRIINQFMGDEMEPIEYATKEEITANFMVPEQSYVSKLTEADVAEASCTDSGNEYEIVIKLKTQRDPVAGSGVGAVFDVIEAHEVTDSVSFVDSFSTEYYDCTVKCKIDKATGNMTWANYTTPLVLDVVVNMFGTHEASVGLTFEKDYTITY